MNNMIRCSAIVAGLRCSSIFAKPWVDIPPKMGIMKQSKQVQYMQRMEGINTSVISPTVVIFSTNPEHGCRYIADRRPCTARIGSNDHKTHKPDALQMTIRNQFAEQRNHDDGGR
jgi:hypothetical protein